MFREEDSADDEANETFDIAEDGHDSQNFHFMDDSQAWMDNETLISPHKMQICHIDAGVYILHKIPFFPLLQFFFPF